jgi:hypothetical protein
VWLKVMVAMLQRWAGFRILASKASSFTPPSAGGLMCV